MKRILALILAILLILAGCGGTNMEKTYQQITQEKAKEIMETQNPIVLDVREQDEFDAGHIPGAVLLPIGTITKAAAAAVIDDLDAVVLVYCQSGIRSRKASQVLAGLGYTNIYNFGGIHTWPYEVE